MTTVRFPISFFLSVLATVSLFWFLGLLIAPVNVGTIPVLPGIDFTNHIPETEAIRIPRVRPPIPKPRRSEVSPVVIEPTVVRPENDPEDLTPQGWGEGELGVPPGPGTEIVHVGGSDRGPVPQIRIEPDYPTPARDRGIEGWVTFRFTITREGRVKDIEIVDSQPPRIWDSATVRAVSNWRYQPALKDGVPVEQEGVRATYRFELERR
jgi:protein TonB